MLGAAAVVATCGSFKSVGRIERCGEWGVPSASVGIERCESVWGHLLRRISTGGYPNAA